ncbi:hypothetical protein DEH69_14755 [Streptomyces sp. PT12]|nr:hypothetical protein DEH69_14755 [Streptomyces sp. PT12]
MRDQAAFADFLASGACDRQLRRCQRAYRERRDALVAALGEHCPGAEVTEVAAGLHATVTLPERFGPEGRFLKWPAKAGVSVRTVRELGGTVSKDDRARLVLGYAHVTPTRIVRAARLLGEAAREPPAAPRAPKSAIHA